MRNRTFLAVVAIVLVIAIVLYYTYSRSATTSAKSIALGVEFNAHAAPFFMVLDGDLLRKSNINLTSLLLFRTGMELAAAVARGEVVAGQACLGPIIMMIDRGIPVKIVGKVHDGGFALVVNPSKVGEMRDLSGRAVYTPGPGTQAYFLALKMQDRYNISFSEIKTMPPQEILAGLLSGSIDAAILPKPLPEVAESKGLKILLESSEVWPNMPGSYLFATIEYLEKNPDVARVIATLVENAVDYVKKEPVQAAKTLAKWLKISEDVALKAIKSIQWGTEIDVRQIQDYIDFMYSKGVIKERYNASSLVASV
jgi:NitT/TauT family transport system substrate-binding protein